MAQAYTALIGKLIKNHIMLGQAQGLFRDILKSTDI